MPESHQNSVDALFRTSSGGMQGSWPISSTTSAPRAPPSSPLARSHRSLSCSASHAVPWGVQVQSCGPYASRLKAPVFMCFVFSYVNKVDSFLNFLMGTAFICHKITRDSTGARASARVISPPPRCWGRCCCRLKGQRRPHLENRRACHQACHQHRRMPSS